MTRIGSWNLLNYRANDPRGPEIGAVIRDMDVDVLAVQEIRASTEDTAGAVLDELAALTGMTGRHRGQPAIGVAASDFSVGLLWRDTTVAVRDGSIASWSTGWGLNHALTTIVVEHDGGTVRLGSYHGSPFDKQLRTGEAARVLASLDRGDGIPGLIGGDFNSVSAARVICGDQALYYDPDPYAGHPWLAKMVYQCTWTPHPNTGEPTDHRADRSPGELLWAAGLRDVAALVDAPWTPTAGHHADDPFGRAGIDRRIDQRIDQQWVTADLADAVSEHEVHDTIAAHRCSDHWPIITSLSLSH